MSLWWVGATGSFLATSANTLGVNCQKLSALQEEAKSPNERSSYFTQRTWALGMGLIVCGSLIDFGSLALAAQSVVAPIKSSAFVLNIIIANQFLGEEYTKRDIIGCCTIVSGSLLSVIFGNQESRSIDINDVARFFVDPTFVGYGIFVCCWCVANYLVGRVAESKRSLVMSFLEDLHLDEVEGREIYKSLKTNASYLEAQADYKPWMIAHSFVYCSLGGTLGGQSLIFVKCVAEMLRTTIGGDNQMIYPLTYAFVVIMALFIVGQVHYLNQGLIISDAMFVVPVYQCFFISFSAVGGLIFYQEYLVFTALNWAFSAIGLSFVLIGVFILTSRGIDEMDVQFVKTDHVLLNSTFELPQAPPDIEEPPQPMGGMENEWSESTAQARKMSISLRLQGNDSFVNPHSGGVFTELPMSTTPLSREIIYLGRELHRTLTPLSTHTTRRRPENMSTDRLYSLQTKWTLFSDDSDGESTTENSINTIDTAASVTCEYG